MFLPKLLAAPRCRGAVPVASAHAAAPWSDPVAVPGSTGQAGAPQVLFTRTRGGAIAFNGAGSIPGAPTLRSVLGDTGPLAGDAVAGRAGLRHHLQRVGRGRPDHVRRPVGPARARRDRARDRRAPGRRRCAGRDTGGARVAAAAAPHAGTAGASRPSRAAAGTSTSSASSARTRPRRPSASPTSGQHPLRRGRDQRVAATCSPPGTCTATIQARLWYGGSKHFGPIQNLGHGQRRDAPRGRPRRRPARDRRVGRPARERGQHGPEGDRVGHRAQRAAAASGCRPSSSRRSRTRRSPAGAVIQAAYTSTGRGIVAWSGRNAVRAAFVNGRSIGAPQDLAPIPSSPGRRRRDRPRQPRRRGERRRGGDDGRLGRRADNQSSPRRCPTAQRRSARPSRSRRRVSSSPTRAPRSTRSPTSSSWPGGLPNPPPRAASRSRRGRLPRRRRRSSAASTTRPPCR